jgi:hypothetical protein
MSVSKSAFALRENVQAFIEQFGVEKIGFLTLTFADDVPDAKEANRRLNSLMTNFLGKQIPAYILIRERQKRGSWHFHLLAALPFDVQAKGRWSKNKFGSGQKFSTANENLLGLWSSFRENMPKYGFGRHELLPVRKSGRHLASYLSKYIGKHMSSRSEADKGVRLVSISRPVFDKDGNYVSGFLRKVGSVASFGWHSPFMTKLRRKVAMVSSTFSCHSPAECLQELGKRWGYFIFREAGHLVRLCDAVHFNRDQYHHVPFAPHVFFHNGQIISSDTGEIYF